MKIALLTCLALIAFAANSVLCRLALGGGAIDALSFTAIRLLSGVAVLWVILLLQSGRGAFAGGGNWLSAAMLFLYAICFSLAYITLDTGSGALILFGAVQLSMLVIALLSGTRLRPGEWAGMALAFAGFVYLVLPGAGAPTPLGFLLMSTAGVAWGIYTLRGRGSGNPLADTAWNFLRTLPLVALVILAAIPDARLSLAGVSLAMLSGGLASGVGYTIWYAALPGLSATRAAVVQLGVPIIAALGGVVLVAESLTLRLALSAAVVLGGIALVIRSRPAAG